MKGPRRVLSVLALAVLTTTAAVPPTSTPEPDYARIDDFLRVRMAETKTPGLAYAIVTPDEVAHVGALGHDGRGDPVTEHTPFLWGSVAKPVTATAVMTLVDAGEVALDEPVRTYLPDFTLADEATAARTTVRHLLSHASGIPEHTGSTDRFDDSADPYAAAVADLARVQPLFPPGESFEYSSANYLLLGAIVEAVTGQRFDAYLQKHVLDPLGMDGAITSRAEADAELPGGHSYAFGQAIGVTTRYDQAGASYGYLGGTVEDLAHFAMGQLAGGRYGPARVLRPASVQLMHTGGVRVTGRQRYGLGWRDDTRNADLGTRTVWHAGASPGYQALVVLLPEQGRGIVVLQNVYGFFQDAPLVHTGLQAARILAGGEPESGFGDDSYPWFVAGLVVVLGVLTAAVGFRLYRLARPSTRPERRARILIGSAGWALAGVTLAALAWLVVPSTAGASLRLIRLWAPDVGWLLTAIALGGAALAAVHLIAAGVRLRRASTRSTARSDAT